MTDPNADAWRSARIACWLANLEEARQHLPDYDDIVGAGGATVPLSPALAEALLECDRAAELAYRFARRPWEAAQIASLPPLRAMRAVAQIEAGLESLTRAAADAAPPQATLPDLPPPPLMRLAGSDAGASRTEDLPMAAYVAAMNARARTAPRG